MQDDGKARTLYEEARERYRDMDSNLLLHTRAVHAATPGMNEYVQAASDELAERYVSRKDAP